MTRFKELAGRAATAHSVYESFGGIPEDTDAYHQVFPPPVCNKAEPRTETALRHTSRKGDYVYKPNMDIPVALIDTRLVYGLSRWIPSAPNRIRVPVMIKNPLSMTDTPWDDSLGVTNVLILYKTGLDTRLMMGGIIRKNVYAMRPIFQWDVEERILSEVRRLMRT